MALCVLSQHIVDTRSHDIVDTMSQYFVDSFEARFLADSRHEQAIVAAHTRHDHQLRPDSTRRANDQRILQDPENIPQHLLPDPVPCRHRIRGRTPPTLQSPHHPARRYGPEVINQLVRIRKQLKKDGWDYGPKTIHYEATVQDSVPGGMVPPIATIARLLSGVGHVDRNPRKRPKSSYLPFVRSTAMTLWQLDAFEYRISEGKVLTVYQLLDDATRYDVGSSANQQHENSHDAHDVLARAITCHGAPKELLSDNSKALNQLRGGGIGAVEVFLASKGTMPISGMLGRPTTPGKNERSHQTLRRFLEANKPQDLTGPRRLITRYREH